MLLQNFRCSMGVFRLSLALLGLLLFVGIGVALTVDDVSEHLVCLCGCGEMVINTCQCDHANKVRAVIGQRIKAGMSKEEIIRSFVEEHGEQILAAPTKSGFNLTAWALPFLALALGGWLVPVVIVRWVRVRRRMGLVEGRKGRNRREDREYAERLDRELERFDE